MKKFMQSWPQIEGYFLHIESYFQKYKKITLNSQPTLHDQYSAAKFEADTQCHETT